MELTKNLVVGVDGSDSSTTAVRWAADEGIRRGAKLKLVHVWYYSPGCVVPTDDNLAHAEKILNDAATIATDRGAQVATLLLGGPPVHTLVRESESAEMLVLGNYGQGRIADILLGSISSGCIRHATCPIVVIPAAMTADTASAPLSATNRGAAFNVAQCGLSID